jgi:hypothetical protein
MLHGAEQLLAWLGDCLVRRCGEAVGSVDAVFEEAV